MLEKTTVSLIGSLLAGIAASLCCVGPLILLLLGFGGAWVSNLTVLEPYRPIFIGIALIALSIAYLRIFRVKSEQSCEQGKVCAQPQVNRVYKRLFIGVVLVVLASIVSPYLIPLIYG
ncbi:MAG: mercuric transporter MerT family protein [Methylococcales bacterium]